MILPIRLLESVWTQSGWLSRMKHSQFGKMPADKMLWAESRGWFLNLPPCSWTLRCGRASLRSNISRGAERLDDLAAVQRTCCRGSEGLNGLLIDNGPTEQRQRGCNWTEGLNGLVKVEPAAVGQGPALLSALWLNQEKVEDGVRACCAASSAVS